LCSTVFDILQGFIRDSVMHLYFYSSEGSTDFYTWTWTRTATNFWFRTPTDWDCIWFQIAQSITILSM